MPSEAEIPFGELLAPQFIYQRVQFHDGVVLNLTEHLAVVERAFQTIYHTQSTFSVKEITHAIASLVRKNRYQTEGCGVVVLLCFFRAGEGAELLIVCERPLIEVGYTVSSLRPVAVTNDYTVPYGEFTTSLKLSASRFYERLARGAGGVKSIRAEGDALVECGDAPLFGIRGRTLFTAPLGAGVGESVERELVIGAAARAKLEVVEEAIKRTDLFAFDELFYADCGGITSISECDGAKFMTLLVTRIVHNF
jgi:branched-subunit amino acid aminotransferase/4-amino-4-deoxychorismate lyase